MIMDRSKYRCVLCGRNEWIAEEAVWQCVGCGHQYRCISGIPRLYIEEQLGPQDRTLRDRLYDAFLGRYYSQVMPFLGLPVRPAKAYWKGWAVYGVIILLLMGLGLASMAALIKPLHVMIIAIVIMLDISVVWFLSRNRYLFYLLVLALPVKISLLTTKFRPVRSFGEVHKEALDSLRAIPRRIEVLDVATGSCNSLYRHGWMTLDANYTGIDLSETMLLQGQKLMAERGVPVDLVLGDACQLPFVSGSFDVILSYGAVNGYSDPSRAIREMVRVAKPGALLLFLDEQLYEGATAFERLYFEKVLAGHNVINHCPVESMPPSLKDVVVHQIYAFYYICTCRKAEEAS